MFENISQIEALYLMVMLVSLIFAVIAAIGFVKFIACAAKSIKTKKASPKIVVYLFMMLPLIYVVSSYALTANRVKWTISRNLGYCALQGTADEFEKMLQSGIGPDCRFYMFSNIPADTGDETILHTVAGAGPAFTEEKTALLIAYGADIEWRYNRLGKSCHYTPDEHKSQKYMDEIGENDDCGATPLITACRYNHYGAAKVLIENGADVNAADYCGDTPLIRAVDSGADPEVIKLLLDNGADKSIRGISGTALEIAENKNLTDIAELLK